MPAETCQIWQKLLFLPYFRYQILMFSVTFWHFRIKFELIDIALMGLGPNFITIGQEMPILETCMIFSQNTLFFTKFRFLYVLEMAVLTTFRYERCAVPKRPQNSKNRHFTISIYVWESPCNRPLGWLIFLNFAYPILRPTTFLPFDTF